MASAPHFRWPPHPTPAGNGSDAPEMSLVLGTATSAAAADTSTAPALLVSPDQGALAARARVRRTASSGPGKQHQQQKAGAAAKKPPQRGLGVAELERLRCGGDPLLELGVLGGDAGAQVHGPVPVLHCNHHHHHHVRAPAFDAAYCSSLLVQPPPPPPPAPAANPGCYVQHHSPPSVAGCHSRVTPSLAPEQQYFMDRWGRMGGYSLTGSGAGTGGGDHHHAPQLLPSLAPPEHPSSQSKIWRPAASSSSSSCLQSGHRCDLCARASLRMMRPFAERGAPPPPSAPLPSPTATTAPDYSVYDLAAAMATARQGGDATAFSARDKKEVREIEFFPTASTLHSSSGGLDASELVMAPVSSSSSYGTGSCAAAAAPLDLSLRL